MKQRVIPIIGKGKGINPDIVAEGPEEAPADLRVTGNKPSLPLASRDREVQLALDTLKSHEQFPGRVARVDPLATHK